MKASRFILPGLAVCCLAASSVPAQIPHLLNYQGRVAVNGTSFNGNGHFKFALVNGDGSVACWSNDGSSTNGSQPTAAVPITVSNGLYSVALGDTSLTNMTAALPPRGAK